MTDIIWEELFGGMPDKRQLVRILIRLLAAMLLGAVVGIQRERTHKPAGLRTHMLVSLGAALFVLAPLESGMSLDGISRVIQGLATGIGFIGGGAILKLTEQRVIEGLTSAAAIWMTAAVGAAAGLGRLPLALLSIILTLVILTILGQIEAKIESRKMR
ncbi:MAG: MgtC/SapB family protein [Blastocatellia bacterium]|nr:MgtC/SapB family protein [Blastocatellia bacterium]